MKFPKTFYWPTALAMSTIPVAVFFIDFLVDGIEVWIPMILHPDMFSEGPRVGEWCVYRLDCTINDFESAKHSFDSRLALGWAVGFGFCYKSAHSHKALWAGPVVGAGLIYVSLLALSATSFFDGAPDDSIDFVYSALSTAAIMTASSALVTIGIVCWKIYVRTKKRA